MEASKKKSVVVLLGLAFLLGIILLVLSNISNRQITKQKATGSGLVTVALTPATKTLAPGESVDVSVVATATSPVSLITTSVNIEYQASLVSISNPACGDGLTGISPSATGGTISINCYKNQAGSPSVVVIPLAAGQSAVIGRFTVTAGTNIGTTSLVIGSAMLVDPLIVAGAETDVSGTVTGATYTIRQGVTNQTVTVSLNPSSGTLTKGTDNTINVVLTSSRAISFSGADIKINYNPNEIEAIFADNVNPLCATGLSNSNSINQSQGLINIVCFSPGGRVSLGTANYTLGGFKVRVKDSVAVGSVIALTISEATVTDESQVNYVGLTQSANYTVASGAQPTPTATPTPTVTLTPTPTGTPVPGEVRLAFSIKSQGIFDKRADQKVTVKVKKGTFEKLFTNVNLTADGAGVYSGYFTLDGVAPGSGYAIFVKGPRHLAKKFCENNQAKDKRCGETGAITLTTGMNPFNWTQIFMEGGDLPLANGGQNGVVNSADWNFIVSHFDSSAVADLAIADINLDGVVNVGDRLLLRNTLETKYEEDY